MSENLALPTILNELERRVATPEADPLDLRQVLVAMQRLGLPRGDLEVHLERIRAVNDVTGRDESVERNCVLALEIVVGAAGDLSMSWDHSEMASIYVSRVIEEEVVRANLEFALAPSDMLPARPGGATVEEALEPGRLAQLLGTGDWRPSRSHEFRVPKDPFTTRPAALLAFADRLVYEVLASTLEANLDEALPAAVIWPRTRTQIPDARAFRATPTTWECAYVVKADIASFYESVDHSLLAMIVGGTLDGRSDSVQAIEHFLGAVMGRTSGLPQGPLASDVLASAYLVLLDRRLAEHGWDFVRYADDYFIAADSMADGRAKLEQLETYLADHHLRLAGSKTRILRQTTYVDALDRPPAALAQLQADLRQRQEEYLRSSDDRDDLAEALSALGADEQLLFDVLYHGTMTIEDAIEELGPQLDPDLTEVYRIYLRRVDSQLRAKGPGDDAALSLVPVRECLAHLAAASDTDLLEVAERILPWFPGLGPVMSSYLEAAAAIDAEAADEVLVRLLAHGELPDWTAAWLCRSAQRRQAGLTAALRDQLVVLAERGGSHDLTRMGAVWALAAHQSLEWDTWRRVIESINEAARAELILALQSDRLSYPSDPSTGLPPGPQY